MTTRRLVNVLDAGPPAIEFPCEMRREFLDRLHRKAHGRLPPGTIDQIGSLFLDAMEVYETMKVQRR